LIDYDTIVVGGGLSGLLTAKEIASSGFTVKVLEEDSEIGIPQKCDGLVSMRGLRDIGVSLPQKILKKLMLCIKTNSSQDADFQYVLDSRPCEDVNCKLHIGFSVSSPIKHKFLVENSMAVLQLLALILISYNSSLSSVVEFLISTFS
jgi:choline dehydrogenase-like flavoprotein